MGGRDGEPRRRRRTRGRRERSWSWSWRRVSRHMQCSNVVTRHKKDDPTNGGRGPPPRDKSPSSVPVALDTTIVCIVCLRWSSTTSWSLPPVLSDLPLGAENDRPQIRNRKPLAPVHMRISSCWQWHAEATEIAGRAYPTKVQPSCKTPTGRPGQKIAENRPR